MVTGEERDRMTAECSCSDKLMVAYVIWKYHLVAFMAKGLNVHGFK
jgi:hypothetical protein